MSQTARKESADARLSVHALAQRDARAQFADDVRRGLTARPKRLQPKYFYDELGSLLFDAICLLPEYYLTRAEDEILRARADEIVAAVAGPARPPALSLLEFGSGSAVKTRLLIEAILRRQPSLTYRPVDISPKTVESSARSLLQSYPRLAVEAFAGDYDAALSLLSNQAREGRGASEDERTLALFLGSNVGNFDPAEAEAFLTAVRGCLRAGDALLLGADLKKDPGTLLAAYDDPLGLTAAFNLNLLARINREFDADFDLRAFRHVARYDAAAGRVELYVESLRAQAVRVRELDLTVEFAAGELTHMENSHKYDPPQLDALAARTGFRLSRAWTDAAGRFSSNLFVAV
ncbi:MAG TPA: L-histidine N(alpha)-methyltransferase [Pyrinomonadaceae bacterium]|nr:L-histidine N(alpha)-methyltransferase [Pyrinomonadaceae bacterium]